MFNELSEHMVMKWRHTITVEIARMGNILQLSKVSRTSLLSGSVSELSSMLVFHPKNPGSNIGIDRKYFLVLFVSHLNSNL
jgi:hypothetical protein